MLTGIHFLLTYTCLFECDHCFVFGSPQAKGTFRPDQIREILDEAVKIGTVNTIYFEGGEPFLFYSLMLEGVRLARERGFSAGIVTNGYWATSVEAAEQALAPLHELGITDLSVSDDAFHYEEEASPAKIALAAAERLGMPAGSICIEKPLVDYAVDEVSERGLPIIGGGVRFRGRAVETLTEGLPTRPWQTLTECPHEDLRDPGRVHVDAYGHVHLCQGLSMGNMWETPLSLLVAEYRAEEHPICSPLLEGGPALLAERYGIEPQQGYIEECHFCYETRKALRKRFPELLAPGLVYGMG